MFLLFVCVFSAGRGPNTSEAHRGGGGEGGETRYRPNLQRDTAGWRKKRDKCREKRKTLIALDFRPLP